VQPPKFHGLTEGHGGSGVRMLTVSSAWHILARLDPGLGHSGANVRRQHRCTHP
jgi:hypothetical protein